MTLTDLKKLIRKYVKVLPGGPAPEDITRGKGMIAVLDALAEEVKSVPAGIPLPIAYTLAQAQQELRDEVDLTAGARYDITGNWNATGAPATVFVQALRGDAFSPSGILLTGGVYSRVKVDVVAGTSVADAGGKLYAGTGTNTDGAMTQKATSAALGAITALVPAKATANNQFATLADIGQITFVDVPLVLTNGSYAIPVDCTGKRFIISDGTADTFINLRALNNDSVGKVFALSITNGVRQQLKALAFGQYTGGDYVELGETALLLVGKQAAGPGFYYNAFKVGSSGGGPAYTDAQAAAAALASLVAGNSQHQGVRVSDVGGVPKLTVAGAVTDLVRLRMPASGAGNLAEGQDLRDADAGGNYRLTATTNVARFAIINPAGPTTLFDGKATDFPAGGVPLQGATWFTYQIVSVDVTQPVFLELSLIH